MLSNGLKIHHVLTFPEYNSLHCFQDIMSYPLPERLLKHRLKKANHKHGKISFLISIFCFSFCFLHTLASVGFLLLGPATFRFLMSPVIACTFLLSPFLPSSALAPAQQKPWLRLALFSVDPATGQPPTCESLISNSKHFLQI